MAQSWDEKAKCLLVSVAFRSLHHLAVTSQLWLSAPPPPPPPASSLPEAFRETLLQMRTSEGRMTGQTSLVFSAKQRDDGGHRLASLWSRLWWCHNSIRRLQRHLLVLLLLSNPWRQTQTTAGSRPGRGGRRTGLWLSGTSTCDVQESPQRCFPHFTAPSWVVAGVSNGYQVTNDNTNNRQICNDHRKPCNKCRFCSETETLQDGRRGIVHQHYFKRSDRRSTVC